MKVALIVGHNERSEGAFSNVLKQSEYKYYLEIANIINKLDDSIDIYIRKPHGSYTKEMSAVVSSMNLHHYDFALELHFNNVTNTAVHGAICLAHVHSSKGQKLAKDFLEKLCKEYSLKNSGIVNVLNEDQRGGFGVSKTNCPYVLIEPFFGNNMEANKFIDKEKFAKFILDFIHNENLS